MIVKVIKYGSGGFAVLIVVGGLLFGQDVVSYFRSSAREVQRTVKDAVPIEFELQRARDMIDDIVPELHMHIRMIAQDEVEFAALEQDIAASGESLDDSQKKIERLRDMLRDEQQVSYRTAGQTVSREHVTEQLAARFARFRDAEMILASKQRLLETRQRSLQAAMQMMDRARARKAELEQQVEALAAKHRLLKASSVASNVKIDGSQLSNADQLLRQIQKRLNIAERVLAHESDFVEIEEVPVSETELLSELDEHFGKTSSDGVAVATAIDDDGSAK